jgi:hypothetical protein
MAFLRILRPVVDLRGWVVTMLDRRYLTEELPTGVSSFAGNRAGAAFPGAASDTPAHPAGTAPAPLPAQ